MLTQVAVRVRRWIGREKSPYAHATQMPPIAVGIPRLLISDLGGLGEVTGGGSLAGCAASRA